MSSTIINQLEKNKNVFFELLKNIDSDMYHWSQAPEKWNLLYIVCHLYDEERDDFRSRVKWLLEKPGQAPPPFNQLDWIEERDYKNQDYITTLKQFIEERERSIIWLNSLKDPKWQNGFEHPKFGHLSANYYLNNWLAHDYLHMRQILKLKFDYLEYQSGTNLDYAGKW